jgi:hypothetical protein
MDLLEAAAAGLVEGFVDDVIRYYEFGGEYCFPYG